MSVVAVEADATTVMWQGDKPSALSSPSSPLPAQPRSRSRADEENVRKQRRQPSRSRPRKPSPDVAARRIQNAFKCWKNAMIFHFLKACVRRAEDSVSPIVLRLLAPSERAVVQDNPEAFRVRFRFGGTSYPPQILYKLYQVKGNTVTINAADVFDSDERGADSACAAMGQRMYLEQVALDLFKRPMFPTSLQDAYLHQSQLDETPPRMGGRGNYWRAIGQPSPFVQTDLGYFDMLRQVLEPRGLANAAQRRVSLHSSSAISKMHGKATAVVSRREKRRQSLAMYQLYSRGGSGPGSNGTASTGTGGNGDVLIADRFAAGAVHDGPVPVLGLTSPQHHHRAPVNTARSQHRSGSNSDVDEAEAVVRENSPVPPAGSLAAPPVSPRAVGRSRSQMMKLQIPQNQAAYLDKVLSPRLSARGTTAPAGSVGIAADEDDAEGSDSELLTWSESLNFDVLDATPWQATLQPSPRTAPM